MDVPSIVSMGRGPSVQQLQKYKRSNGICLLCGAAVITSKHIILPSKSPLCDTCFRMKSNASRVLHDMDDYALFARHMCFICKNIETSSTNSATDDGTYKCPSNIITKWRLMRKRHVGNEDEVIDKDVFCSKMKNGAAMCSYCGKYIATGLDRVDSSIGYTTDNTIPSCSLCNFTKADLNQTVFLEHACRICKLWNQEIP